MVNELRELGPNIHVRDAYLFAAPILCDVVSAGGDSFCPVIFKEYNIYSTDPRLAFNNRMNHFSNE